MQTLRTNITLKSHVKKESPMNFDEVWLLSYLHHAFCPFAETLAITHNSDKKNTILHVHDHDKYFFTKDKK